MWVCSTTLSDDVHTEPEPNNEGEKLYNTLIIDFLSIIFLTFGRADFSLFHKNSQRTSVDIVTRAGKLKETELLDSDRNKTTRKTLMDE